MPELWDHQKEALKHIQDGRVLCGDVGSGKSLTAVAYYKQSHFPKPLYIITTAKKRDSLEWQGELTSFGVGISDDGRSREVKGGVLAVIDSWNNIRKYADVEDAFFIFDEQRLVGSGAWVKSFYQIAKRNRWILLSATPGDNWADYIPLFVANGFFKNKTHMEREHAVWSRYSKFPKIERWTGEETLRRYRRQLLVRMPDRRHTVRHDHFVVCEYDKDLYKTVWKTRWNPYTDLPIPETGELFYTIRKVVNTHESRAENLLGLMKEHPRAVIFYNFDHELEILRGALQKACVPFSEWNGHKHDPLPTGERWAYLCQYTSASEGWNCVTTDTVIFYSLNYSYRITEQCKGRIDRMNTKYIDLHYYFLRSMSGIDSAILKALKEKRTFNESAYSRKASNGP